MSPPNNLGTKTPPAVRVCVLQEIVKEWIGDVESGRRIVKWLYVERAADATPIDVEFGDLEHLLISASRFRHCNGDGTWTLVSNEVAKKLKLRCGAQKDE